MVYIGRVCSRAKTVGVWGDLPRGSKMRSGSAAKKTECGAQGCNSKDVARENVEWAKFGCSCLRGRQPQVQAQYTRADRGG